MKTSRAFTLIELLTVIAIIAVLMSLIISVAGMVQTKASRDRASAEIAALSTAMESYKADNGIYPQTAETDVLVAKGTSKSNSATSPQAKASLALYTALSGDDDGNFQRTGDEKQNPVYFEFETKKGMMSLTGSAGSTSVKGLTDPWGDFYGYSTAYAAGLQKDPPDNPLKGYNPTFDLWSYANAGDSNEEKWVKNW